MKLLYTQNLEEFEAEIVEVEASDFAQIKRNNQFSFDWHVEQSNHVFKLVSIDDDDDEKILGLLSLIDYPQELRIHINLVESSKENIGKDKKIDGIAGCLLAFAAQVAFEKGYHGFASLVPKTVLIKLYVEKYGFTQYGRQLAIEGRSAIRLIQKYL